MEEIEREFDGKGYGDFKLAVGEAVADELEPLQKRYDELMKDKSYIDQCIKTNDERAPMWRARPCARYTRRSASLS